jgi:1-deoxy-D-xylulose-5-phosphate reductoisomerase
MSLDLTKVKELSFFPPDLKKFPLLSLAFQALKEGGIKPCLLNAADEVCVEAFLKGQLTFDRIPQVIETVIGAEAEFSSLTIEEILAADSWGRQKAWKAISDMLG